jgi:hypothetical protein
MTDDILDGIVYPSGEIDLKRRVAGDILRIYEGLKTRPPEDELVKLIEWVFEEIRKNHLHRIQAGRPLDVSAEVQRILSSPRGANLL